MDITTGDVYVGEYSGKNMMNLVMNVITKICSNGIHYEYARMKIRI